ncbi:39S mitochondrial ribosomal protein L46-domain-containing protein [Glomus cerebriforme]|uniref:Large ribosomal subunit protein mL46 n=1 Tax=Glomus cerebriforme TaxID=658196 RepID=A0A397T6Q7_9GLOM|nr:39S mitochondrial ribosomal protein L46-domain-containing protein [Glomus cerebriforme]
MNAPRISYLIPSVTKTNFIKHVNIGKIRRISSSIYSYTQPERPEPKQTETETTIIDNYRLVSGIVLTRPPQILRDPHPFEREYYLYQQKLEQIHSPPFPEDFYFKKGSIAEKRWKEKKVQDKKNALSIFSRFNDKINTDKNSDDIEERDENINDDKSFSDVEEEEIKIASRITQDDLNNNLKSLNRALQRTLYLIVKKPRNEYSWQFPQGGVNLKENLVQAAARELEEECGNKMDVWFVGRRPIGYYKYNYPRDFIARDKNIKGSMVFFMKAHVFAGQVNVDQKEIVDFAWVTKQEMMQFVPEPYYIAVKDMLSEF